MAILMANGSCFFRYRIVVITNQKKVLLKKVSKGGIGDSKSLSIFKTKVASVMKSLGVPLSVYAATEYDEFRKPRTGMWKAMLDDYDLDVEGALDLEGSIFVGDAAGRPGDHSCVDRNFAANIGIQFNTPEEFFRGEPIQPVQVFDPKHFIRDMTSASLAFTKSHGQELVILCGSPGAGKSTFYWKYLQPLKYERVNQDILKSVSMELFAFVVIHILRSLAKIDAPLVAKEYLKAGKPVAIDPETRAHWVKLAKEHNVPVRCIYLSTPQSICKHNNAVRAANPKLESINPENRTFIPNVAFGDFTRRFQEPQISEGFQDITRVDFQFEGDPTAREMWAQHWI
ncbi:DNA kinase/phosphatase Pnk1 [Emydomyces testavorans]|uniref:DNA kinase/phosphatase Pnk1 n=1 Tax=Emydomyces testavorans TaxID=2070801 RepID=A0AAF0IG28_9EURO|nr:DNA kinase/phosphatase Pnk1 [Emydomyces testavorans]